jgi:hypothetical protein
VLEALEGVGGGRNQPSLANSLASSGATSRGEAERANQLLDGAERLIRHIPRLGSWGDFISDVKIYALRNQHAQALTALREAERVGWRNTWRYYRDFEPGLASIRSDPKFKAVFVDIERDMTQQRARVVEE